MKIAFSGAQGTGKSTLMRELKIADAPLFKNYNFRPSGTRDLINYGLPINVDAEDYNTTQMLLLKNHVCNANLYRNAILDRCALDGYVWTKYLYIFDKVNQETMDYALLVLAKSIPKYDILFYIKPEFEIEEDGVRSPDTVYRDQIVDIFEDAIKMLDIHVVPLAGSVEKRMETVLKLALGKSLEEKNQNRAEILKSVIS